MSKKEGHSSGKIFYISQTPEVMGHNCSQNLHMSQEAKAVGHNPTKNLYMSCPLLIPESSPNLCVNSSFSYVVLSTLLLSSRDLTEWSLVYHNTLSYQRFYDLHSIHYDHLEGLHQLI